MLFDLVEDGVLIADPRQVVVAREENQFRSGDPLGEVAGLFRAHDPVSGPLQDERGNPDRGQDGPDVDLGVHPDQAQRRLRTRALHEVRRPEPHEALIAHGARGAGRAAHRSAPVLLDLPEERGQILIGLAPRVVGRALPARVAPVHDERHRPVGVGGGEQGAHRPALGDAEERRALRADGVQHRADVVHPQLERRQLPVGNAIGQTRASLVEQDQPGERREPREEPRVRRFLPVQSDVGDPAGDVDQIERAVPDDLIRDVGIAALGEPRLRPLHRRPLRAERTPRGPRAPSPANPPTLPWFHAPPPQAPQYT